MANLRNGETRHIVIDRCLHNRRGYSTMDIQQKLGMGHNNKGEFFCPKCGNPIQQFYDEHGYIFRRCTNCKNIITDEPDELYN